MNNFLITTLLGAYAFNLVAMNPSDKATNRDFLRCAHSDISFDVQEHEEDFDCEEQDKVFESEHTEPLEADEYEEELETSHQNQDNNPWASSEFAPMISELPVLELRRPQSQDFRRDFTKIQPTIQKSRSKAIAKKLWNNSGKSFQKAGRSLLTMTFNGIDTDISEIHSQLVEKDVQKRMEDFTLSTPEHP